MNVKSHRSFLVLLPLALACLTPTEVSVVIHSSELTCPNGGDLAFDSLSIVTSPTASGLLSDDPNESILCNADGSKVDLGSLVLVPNKSNDHAEVVIAAGVDVTSSKGETTRETGDECLADYRAFLRNEDPAAKCGGGSCLPCVIATRGVGFVSHEKLTLDIDLSATCRGQFCQAGQTCGTDGSCVSNDTNCRGNACDLKHPTDGAGGAGGATSAATASASSGGGSSPFTPVGDANGVPVGALADLWGNGTDDVAWAVGQQGLYRCDTQCTLITTPLLSATRITGYGNSLTLTDGKRIVLLNASTEVSTVVGPVDCTVVDLFSLATATYVAVQPAGGATSGYSSSITAPCTTNPIVAANPVNAIWAFDGAPPTVWAAGNKALEPIGTGVGSPDPFPAPIAGIWGQQVDQISFVASCQLGSNFFAAGRNNSSINGPTPEPCNSIWGWTRPDNDADLWFGVSGGAVGVHLSVTPTEKLVATDVSLEVGIPAPDHVRTILASPGFIWVGTGTGLFHAPRPNVP